MRLVLIVLSMISLSACAQIPGYHGIQNMHGAKESFNNCLIDMLDTRNNRGSGC